MMEWSLIEQHVLRQFLQPKHVQHVQHLGSAGGFSGARFWRLATHDRRLCLRAWPPEHPSAERLTWIHEVLRHVHRQGFTAIAVPMPTASCISFVCWQQRLWELTAWLPGAADFAREPLLSKLQAATGALADFHVAAATFPACSVTVGPPAGLESRRELMKRLDQGLFEQLEQSARSRPSPWNAAAYQILTAYDRWHDRVARLLSEALARPVRNHVCLRDIWHDHVLFLDGRVSGLVDFGAMQIDCAAADISRLLGSLVADDKPR